MEILNQEELWKHYMDCRESVYSVLLPQNVKESIISEANWIVRSRFFSAAKLGINPKPGDICFIDYGQQYINEMGYQHFGLIMNVYNGKALVIPLTSNEKHYAEAYDPVDHPKGKKHLMRFGKIHSLEKPSVLFLNDMRFINTARILDVTASISTRSALFKSIKERMKSVIFEKENV